MRTLLLVLAVGICFTIVANAATGVDMSMAACRKLH